MYSYTIVLDNNPYLFHYGCHGLVISRRMNFPMNDGGTPSLGTSCYTYLVQGTWIVTQVCPCHVISYHNSYGSQLLIYILRLSCAPNSVKVLMSLHPPPLKIIFILNNHPIINLNPTSDQSSLQGNPSLCLQNLLNLVPPTSKRNINFSWHNLINRKCPSHSHYHLHKVVIQP